MKSKGVERVSFVPVPRGPMDREFWEPITPPQKGSLPDSRDRRDVDDGSTVSSDMD
jgi:hypothetical protein